MKKTLSTLIAAAMAIIFCAALLCGVLCACNVNEQDEQILDGILLNDTGSGNVATIIEKDETALSFELDLPEVLADNLMGGTFSFTPTADGKYWFSIMKESFCREGLIWVSDTLSAAEIIAKEPVLWSYTATSTEDHYVLYAGDGVHGVSWEKDGISYLAAGIPSERIDEVCEDTDELFERREGVIPGGYEDEPDDIE